MTHLNPVPDLDEPKQTARRPFLTEKRRDALICLSFANFCFVRVWGETLSYRRTDAIWMRTIPSPMDYAAVMTAVVLLAAALYGAVRLSRRYLGNRGRRVALFASFGLAAIPLNGLRASLSSLTIYLKSPLLGLIGTRTWIFLILPVCAGLLWLGWKFQRRIGALAGAILITLSPFCLLTFGQGLMAMYRYAGQPYHDGPLASRLANGQPAKRVVWIIFDEWDYRLSFAERRKDLAMPEIDRLRAESLFATGARAPGPNTDVSVPSLITGRRVEAVTSESGAGVAVKADGLPGTDATPWGESSTIFRATRNAGFNVGLVGWYLPYCRTMTSVLSECAWWPMPIQANSTQYHFLAGLLGTGFWSKVAGLSISLLETDSLSPFGQSSSTRHKVSQYVDLLAASKKDVADPTLGLVFLHIPVPHALHAYNRFTGKMDNRNHPISGYIDSLALLDRMTGELRAAMEASGLWDGTVLLISADHPFRASQALDGKRDWRVPFLLRFPRQASGVIYRPPFDTILSANLVQSILRGDVSTAAEASDWIDRHRGQREAPVQPAP